MHKSANWALSGLCAATLLLLVSHILIGTAQAATYEIAMPMFIGDTKRDQILLAATHAAEVAFNESLKAVGADLAITYRVIPRFSVANPLSHVILTNELITPNLVAAFDATRGEVRLPSYLLANASVRDRFVQEFTPGCTPLTCVCIYFIFNTILTKSVPLSRFGRCPT